jgi:Cu-Zn family superoxide dismutase
MAAALLVVTGMIGLSWAETNPRGPVKGVSGKVGKRARVVLAAKSGSKAGGEASFVEGSSKVTLHLLVTGVEPGTHAVHIHEKGDCSAADASSAGGHWNPTSVDHGKWGTPPFHAGDLGNLEVGADGTARLTLASKEWSIGGSPGTNVVGRALIVHAKADDYVTQPTGNAGGRIACGVIELEK